jgi:formylglycine-generating enzyme required for sulfatase activity
VSFRAYEAVNIVKSKLTYKLVITVPVAGAVQQRDDGIEEFYVRGAKFRMVHVAGGRFEMGATMEQGNDAYEREYPTHWVTLSDYQIGETEVTQELWETVMGTSVRQQREKANSSWSLYGEGGSYPMYYISWDECQEFIKKLNALTGCSFRLPTEAEWEYAARGGKESKGYTYCGSNTLDDVGWYWKNSGDKFLNGVDSDQDWDKVETNHCQTHPVGTMYANELGLYDMSVNVWEWCSDWYSNYSESPQTNPKGPSTGSNRVYRGGGWNHNARFCRVSFRSQASSGYRSYYLGLRLAL